MIFKNFKVIIIISISLVIAAVAFYSIMEFIAIRTSIDSLNNHLSKKELAKDDIPWVTTTDSALLAKQISKAYYTSQITASNSDSIYLTLDLPDSLALLMIKGVTVHEAKISSFKVSNFFYAIDQNNLLELLSKPLIVNKYTSTVKKIPLMIKIAPKDTSEYTPDIVPDTSDVEPVNYKLETNLGINLYIYEFSPERSSDKLSQHKFDLRDRVFLIYKNFSRIFTLKKPTYNPSIRLKLAKKDAKIIFRALPENAPIVLKLE